MPEYVEVRERSRGAVLKERRCEGGGKEVQL